MHNIIILGVPRSGTSLTASLFREAGYHMGEELLPPTVSNPAGYFEDRNMNKLNNAILREVGVIPKIPLRTTAKVLRVFGIKPSFLDQRSWAHLAPKHPVSGSVGEEIRAKMQQLMKVQPFCFKDPRFTYTLPIWYPLLPDDTRFIVVFRSPEDTIRSMLKNARLYEPPLTLTARYCDKVYAHNYDYLLNAYGDDPRFLFVRYEQVLSGERLDQLEEFAGVSVDRSVADESLSRSAKVSDGIPVTQRAQVVFDRLRHAAGA